MPGYFFDTSALVKHYHPEVGSAEVDRLWNDPLQGLFASRLSALEIVSAFAGKVRAGTISATDFVMVRHRFFADIASKRLAAIRLLVPHFKEAERLLRTYALSARLRTLDSPFNSPSRWIFEAAEWSLILFAPTANSYPSPRAKVYSSLTRRIRILRWHGGPAGHCRRMRDEVLRIENVPVVYDSYIGWRCYTLAR